MAASQVAGPTFYNLEVPQGSIICLGPYSWKSDDSRGCYTNAQFFPGRQLIATVTPTATADANCPWLKQFCTDRTLQSSSDKKAQFKSMIEALYFQGPLGESPRPREPNAETNFVSDPISEDMVYRLAKMMFEASLWPISTDNFKVMTTVNDFK
ncbi:MAG: hypothetical protein J3K34DRAFT_144817 [Monoraphidium minutum]|nr:MAG: hypothetical protein J3K34DRAFT_144817 [Monoraphidium minutum]